ncbi:MAG: hypothetical protein M1483_07280 [Actinobacteria bacterium]|jgi:hypothetical protein|nr:hypothetical protein [Actinomycetota bacterium]MCL6105412.1 hypothetical protein [Actinomycetota bacterium]
MSRVHLQKGIFRVIAAVIITVGGIFFYYKSSASPTVSVHIADATSHYLWNDSTTSRPQFKYSQEYIDVSSSPDTNTVWLYSPRYTCLGCATRTMRLLKSKVPAVTSIVPGSFATFVVHYKSTNLSAKAQVTQIAEVAKYALQVDPHNHAQVKLHFVVAKSKGDNSGCSC